MRFRSASKRERSKKDFLPQGIFELWWVASASLRRDWSTALTPLKVRLWTLIVPPSLHPVRHASATRTNANTETRMAGRAEPQCVPASRLVWLLSRDLRLTGRNCQHDPEADR